MIAAPMILAGLVAWSWGEAAGYASCLRIRKPAERRTQSEGKRGLKEWSSRGTKVLETTDRLVQVRQFPSHYQGFP